jgi:hypothetical protein
MYREHESQTASYTVAMGTLQSAGRLKLSAGTIVPRVESVNFYLVCLNTICRGRSGLSAGIECLDQRGMHLITRQ